MAAQTENVQIFGNLVAVEGDKDVLSTQLQLLPLSSKILIIGPLTDALQQPNNCTPFSPRAFVREVHNKMLSRTEIARSFLKDSTEDQPRIVFMNGGSVSARVVCVTEIAARLTNGQIHAAEDIFEEIVDDGVAGLMEQEILQTKESWPVGYTVAEHDPDSINEIQENPSTTAMKAADFLDRKTAELQTSDEDEVEDVSFRRLSLSNWECNTGLRELPAMEKTADTNANDEVIRKTFVTIPTQPINFDHRRDTFGGLQARNSGSKHVHTMSDIDNEKYLLSPPSRSGSAPATPSLIEIGEACIVDIGSKPVRRINSVDRFSKRKSTGFATDSATRSLRAAVSVNNLKEGAQTSESCDVSSYSRGLELLPRTTFVRASQTIIRRSSLVPRQPSFEPVAVVDQETHANEFKKSEMVDASTQYPDDATGQAAFEPVFPLVEDLIIHFTEDTRREIQEAVIRSYKNGSYPAVPSDPVETASSQLGALSRSNSLKRSTSRPQSHVTVETDDEDSYHRRQEADPNYTNSYSMKSKPVWSIQEPTKGISHIAYAKADPPTPASTPPPTLSENAQKFQEFTQINDTTPIATQNSLRSILNMHFPPKNYRQHTYPEDTKLMWTPIFRYDHEIGGTAFDQIIAVGCENGVKKEFFDDVVEQVAKLGMKKNGISRTGRLDIRYLIATAMQVYAIQHRPLHAAENPFLDLSLLATLLIPHLETYLSINEPTRLLLLTYPASHLATVLELRKLLGAKLMKIAGIIDSASNEPSADGAKPKPSTPPNPLSNEGVASFHACYRSGSSRSHTPMIPQIPIQSQSVTKVISPATSPSSHSRTTPSFAKANFLLPSTATAIELSTFLTSITTALVSISTFYIPEAEPVPPVQAPPPRPTFQHTTTLKTAIETRPRTPAKIGRKSIGFESGHHTTKSTNSARMRREEKDWENFYVGGEESEEDDVEKRLMPRAAKVEGRKLDRSKALKLLGLA